MDDFSTAIMAVLVYAVLPCFIVGLVVLAVYLPALIFFYKKNLPLKNKINGCLIIYCPIAICFLLLFSSELFDSSRNEAVRYVWMSAYLVSIVLAFYQRRKN
jgi:hypothetical protein